ncbi:MAG TPA: hypothetical protein VKA84_27895 [Gemmatimonadaceae bacterium]|nr:hypothetical protein [Gemmatimonadaceae bacterium]
MSRTARTASPALWLDLTRRLDAYRARPDETAFGDLPEAARLGAFPVLYDRWAVVLLRPDGAVFDFDTEDGTVRERGEGVERWMALRRIARRLAVPALLELLPERPASALDCGVCGGVGYRAVPAPDGGTFVADVETPVPLPCPACGSLGWV